MPWASGTEQPFLGHQNQPRPILHGGLPFPPRCAPPHNCVCPYSAPPIIYGRKFKVLIALTTWRCSLLPAPPLKASCTQLCAARRVWDSAWWRIFARDGAPPRHVASRLPALRDADGLCGRQILSRRVCRDGASMMLGLLLFGCLPFS